MDAIGLALRPVHAEAVPCKVCDAPAPLFGVQDFNRSCVEGRGLFQPLAGVPVYYRRCERCGLIFTDAFDDWPDEAFAQHIYNEDYGAVDPGYEVSRPAENAGLIARTFQGHAGSLRVLDYGGGNGCCARELAAAGFGDPKTYDRFHPGSSMRPTGAFDLVTCFETLEHMPDPQAGAADIVSFMADESLLLVSTVVQPDDILKQRMHWWYAGPRNGHITLFTYQALARLFGRLGLRLYRTHNGGFHFFCREMPSFAPDGLRATRPYRPDEMNEP